jgi:L,D-transpeptidase-like protein
LRPTRQAEEKTVETTDDTTDETTDGRDRPQGFLAVGGAAWGTLLVVPALLAATAWLVTDVATVRFHRDVTRMAFNDNLELLESVRKEVGASRDSLQRVRSVAADNTGDRPYIVVSIADNRLWYKRGQEVLFTTRVATGTGKFLERAGGTQWKFETPRGRLVVERKDVDPAWVPPDWHYVEAAQRKGLAVVRLERGKKLNAANGAVVTVSGNDVVTRYPDGHEVPFEVREGGEIRLGRSLVIPPFGTNQRKYLGTLGSNRLYLGDGYGIHGTDEPLSIGRAASHGCVRLRNEDAELLYRLVPIGTVVFIY